MGLGVGLAVGLGVGGVVGAGVGKTVELQKHLASCWPVHWPWPVQCPLNVSPEKQPHEHVVWKCAQSAFGSLHAARLQVFVSACVEHIGNGGSGTTGHSAARQSTFSDEFPPRHVRSFDNGGVLYSGLYAVVCAPGKKSTVRTQRSTVHASSSRQQ